MLCVWTDDMSIVVVLWYYVVSSMLVVGQYIVNMCSMMICAWLVYMYIVNVVYMLCDYCGIRV